MTRAQITQIIVSAITGYAVLAALALLARLVLT